MANAGSRLIRAGLTTGVVDGLFASAVNVFYNHSTVPRLFRGVASTVLGRQAMDGGAAVVLLGVFMHFGVAFAWSAVFLFLVTRRAWIRRVVGSRLGAMAVAAVYGPLVFVVMSLMVIPLLTRRPPTFGPGFWIQLIGHAPFVGLPIVLSLRGSRPA